MCGMQEYSVIVWKYIWVFDQQLQFGIRIWGKKIKRQQKLNFYHNHVCVSGCQAPTVSLWTCPSCSSHLSHGCDGHECGKKCVFEKQKKRQGGCLWARSDLFVCDQVCVRVKGIYESRRNVSVPRWPSPSRTPDVKGHIVSEHRSCSFIAQLARWWEEKPTERHIPTQLTVPKCWSSNESR